MKEKRDIYNKVIKLLIISTLVLLFGTFSSNKANAQKIVNVKKDSIVIQRDSLLIEDYTAFSAADSLFFLNYTVIDGDTLPLVLLESVAIVEKKRDYIEEYKFQRLKRNVQKVYPYAKEINRILTEIDSVGNSFDKKRHKNKYLNQLEKDLKNSFKDELKGLTITQGKILTKLVNRETGVTLHELIKTFKSGVTATMYQTLGKGFGYDLKHIFDPENNPEDADIEEIMLELEYDNF